MNLEELRQIADNATPGPWEMESDEIGTELNDYTGYGIKNVAPVMFYSDSDMAHLALDTLDEEDAEFIAAFNPAMVLELLDRLAAVEELAEVYDRCPDALDAQEAASDILKAVLGEQ